MTWRTALSFIPWTEPERKERSGYDRPIFCCGHVYDDQSGAGSGNDVRRPVSAAPLLVRILSPGQRVALWGVGWISLYSPSFYGLLSLVHILPVTFRDLITGRVKDGGWTTSIPAYLPMDYHGAGVYHLSLPGGAVVPVEIGEG